MRIIMGLLLLLCGCSVWENRAECPCLLSVDLVDCADSKDSSVVTVGEWMDDGNLISKEEILPDAGMNCYTKTVPRGFVMVGSYRGCRKMELQGLNLIIPYGADCDSVYAGAARVDCTGELATHVASLHKQYATVFLRMENPTGEMYPYSVRIVSDVAGFNIFDLSPVEGRFCFEPSPVNQQKDRFVFRIPRQKDNSAFIEILDGGIVYSRVDIGSSIRKNRAFSWEAEDLDDIYMDIDFSLSSVGVDIIPWTRRYSVEQFRI